MIVVGIYLLISLLIALLALLPAWLLDRGARLDHVETRDASASAAGTVTGPELALLHAMKWPWGARSLHPVSVALDHLVVAGNLRVDGSRLIVSATPAVDGDGIVRAVHAALRELDDQIIEDQPERSVLHRVDTDPGVEAALQETRERLTAEGHILTERQRNAWWRNIAGALFVSAAAGPILAVITWSWLSWLYLLVAALAFVAAWALLDHIHSRYTTRAAEKLTGKLRKRYAHLDPIHVPAYATYGPAQTALADVIFRLERDRIDPHLYEVLHRRPPLPTPPHTGPC
ncbi:hypothetical protein Cme02nite_15370 [Catellatospora methionotrophica]|uniref:TIGR04222 domain-containing membrane protein n=1 Tax=Catellatospora methionotrophica TaxID=121620 RepID=A0A8J3L6F6_9ACTN|nr:hypothetical protein [Catellatospora methionotrophica]GIG13205.1 hypothetical protein Cme02nite_15370 [Catellatospora methionotrophica]